MRSDRGQGSAVIQGTVSFILSLMAQTCRVAHPTIHRGAGAPRSGTMKAIVQDRYGSADVLELRDIAAPVVGDADVLVRVLAAGCGPDVWHLMTGQPYLARLMVGFRKPKVGVRGWDVAGRVEAVGSGVTGFQPGDEVMGIVEGSFAELAIARPDKLAPKPARLTIEQAAAVPISGVTALQALRDKAGVQPGHKVLIIGAAGGVGSLAVQLAGAFGAEVTGVCSTAKMDLVRSIGAHRVIDYTREDFTDGQRRWEVIVDTAGRRPLAQLRRALTRTGTLVIVGGDGGGPWTGGFFRGVLRAPLLSVFVGQKLRGLNARVNQEDLRTVGELIEAGKLTPVIDRTYPLVETPEALRHLERGHPGGKVIITI
jgi:NADPH:quinone reductase-like Zn-dependent oxidoreductase